LRFELFENPSLLLFLMSVDEAIETPELETIAAFSG
jgi:hypothetical protein